MTVEELIKALEKYPRNLLVAYRCCSEQVLLETDQLKVLEACHPRADGWIQDHRPDMPSRLYLLFPGN